MLLVIPIILSVVSIVTAAATPAPPVAPRALTPLSIRVVSFNIRYATTTPSQGELPWAERKSHVLASMLFNTRHSPETIFGLQEVLHNQLLDILEGLNGGQSPGDWAYIGVGRDDGQTSGEYSPLLYRTSVWNLLDYKTLWLSPTPTVPSVGWDAALTRTLVIGVFEHQNTLRRLVGMATHFDHVGVVARQKSAEMIVDITNTYLSADENSTDGVFVAGDFNSVPEESAYQTIVADPRSLLADTRTIVDPGKRYGHQKTFTSFSGDPLAAKIIDFVFVAPKPQGSTTDLWQIDGHAVLENRFDDEIWSSDHRPVVADLTLL